MKKKTNSDVFMLIAVTSLILSTLEFAYFKYTAETVQLNGVNYSLVGMMQYTNPSDGKVLNTPVYLRTKNEKTTSVSSIGADGYSKRDRS